MKSKWFTINKDRLSVSKDTKQRGYFHGKLNFCTFIKGDADIGFLLFLNHFIHQFKGVFKKWLNLQESLLIGRFNGKNGLNKGRGINFSL